MSKPVPPKEQPKPAGSRAGSSTAVPTSARGGQPAEARPSAPQVSRARVIEPAGAPSHEQIARRAYEIWMGRGMPDGTDHENWLEAEKQLRSGQAAPAPARR